MHTVLIKSFNRPWALDRCLHSLPNMGGINKVVVVDDGTEKKHLDVIKKKYPHIILHTDPRNNGKVEHLRKKSLGWIGLWNGVDPNKTWVAQVKKHAGEHFVLHEDDAYTPLKSGIGPIIEEAKQKKIAYVDISGKFGRTHRVDKIIESLKHITIYANTRDWSWFAAAFCIYRKDLFDHLYSPGLNNHLQEGHLLVRRSKEYYRKNKYRGAYANGDAKIIITDTISSRYNQKMNDALNEAWAKGDHPWDVYYPNLPPVEDITPIFSNYGVDDKVINKWVEWRRPRFKEYTFPYNLDGKIKWDAT